MKVAKKYKIGYASMHKLVTEDLHFKSYKISRGHLLTDAKKAERLQKCKKLRAESRGSGFANVDHGRVFQHDWAPAHGSKSTMSFLEDQIPWFWDKSNLKSNSNLKDLNPMDYAIWSVLEEKACRRRHATLDDLKRDLLAAWEEISVETPAAIVENFKKRVKAFYRR
ncbi:hypothetical protein QR680_018727 [Steinernema hermaphroditum]|uniref:Tc1-like transposase DDE domain-containing protein n=1 Tax=Steinernema hermaphroditum TaxID=289476 RepID=A0AA39HIU3_9BILA|nr:hypothetical protein QR680_018727 [Steinernema hermaphroditum]